VRYSENVVACASKSGCLLTTTACCGFSKPAAPHAVVVAVAVGVNVDAVAVSCRHIARRSIINSCTEHNICCGFSYPAAPHVVAVAVAVAVAAAAVSLSC
jgi:hypothetical protein